MTSNLTKIIQPEELRQSSRWGSICDCLANEVVRSWRDLHIVLGNDAYKRKYRVYCKTCEMEFIFTEVDAHSYITGQTKMEVEDWFANCRSYTSKWKPQEAQYEEKVA